ncbi:MAG: alpha/beta fold hydrolase [Polyangiaceae bacterium]
MALYQERVVARWGERRVELVAETFLLKGLGYRLVVDGETVASKRNWAKRPGRFELVASNGLQGVVKQGFVSTEMTLLVDGEPLETEPPSERQIRQRRRRRWVGIASLLIAMPIIGFSLAAVAPTRAASVAAEHPPFAMRSGRREARCDTLVTRRGCEAPSITGSRSEEVTIPTLAGQDHGLAALKGTLRLPEGPAAPHPAVVLVGGSGGHPRDPEVRGGLVVHHAPFRLYGALADWLVGRGLAVLSYDKRTCRRCYPDFEPDLVAFRFADFEDDLRASLAYLRIRPEVDPAALVLVGHSQGGGIVARIAAEEPGIAAAVMLGGSTHAFAEGLSGQLRRFAALRIAQLDLAVGLLLQSQADGFDACLEKARAEPDVPQKCLHGVTARAFDEEARRASGTRAAILGLPMPFLALQGQLDRNIDPGVILDLRDTLVDRDAEVHFVEGVGHTLVHHEASDAPVLAEGVRQTLDTFLSSVPYPGR